MLVPLPDLGQALSGSGGRHAVIAHSRSSVLDILPQLLVSGLLIGGVYGLLSIGLTLIFGVLRIVNFAQGEFIMLADVRRLLAQHAVGIDPYCQPSLSSPVHLRAWLACGTRGDQADHARRHIDADIRDLWPVGGSSERCAYLLGTGLSVRSRPPTPRSPLSSGLSHLGELPFAFIAAFLMAGALIAFLHFTRDGRALRAMVQNRYAAALMGVNTERLNRLAFGAASPALRLRLHPDADVLHFPTVGVDLIITAFVVVVLGGMGSVAGAVVGGLIIGITQTLTGFYVSVEFKDVMALLLFILILLVRPQGLFGRAGTEDIGTK